MYVSTRHVRSRVRAHQDLPGSIADFVFGDIASDITRVLLIVLLLLVVWFFITN